MSPVSAPPLKIMLAPPATSVKLPVMFGHSICRFRGLSALPQQCAKPHRSEALWLRVVAAAIGKQRHQPGTSGTVLKVVAPRPHDRSSRVEVIAPLIGAGYLRT